MGAARQAAVIGAILVCFAAARPCRADDAPSSAAAPATEATPPAPAAAAVPPAAVPRIDAEIEVDGVLDEPAWKDALVILAHLETRPAENQPAPVTTEARLFYDGKSLYLGFRCEDKDPSSIRARLSDRDTAFNDDFVGVVLDTFHDARRAFEFFVNPLGVQMDLFQDDVSFREDESWDALWESGGRITDDGYVVEVAIPFTSLRFPRVAAGAQTWGIDVVRIHPREHRRQYRNHPMDRNVNCYLCQLPAVTGFEGIVPGLNLELDPTLTGSSSAVREDFPDGGLEGQGTDVDLGASVAWGFTPNLNLGAALNPDFSQVEADAAQLAVNTQFALFYPEKRPFFLEGADFFSTQLNAVFTRNVADPLWGLKLTGKEGRHGLGVFVAHDEVTNVLIPGSEYSDFFSLDEESTDAVLRYRLDVGKSSTLGALVTWREGEGYLNRVAGADGLFRWNDSDSAVFQALGSTTDYPDDVAADYGQSADEFSGAALHAHYEHSARTLGWWLFYDDIGEDFRADLGFMPQVGYRRALAGGRYTWWGEEDDWYTQLQIGNEGWYTEDADGEMLERRWGAWLNVNGPRQSFISVNAGFRDRTFQGVSFEDHLFLNANGEATLSQEVVLGGFFQISDAVDYENVQEGMLHHVEGWSQLRLGRRLRTDLFYVYQDLDVDGGRLFRAQIAELRAYYQLSLRMRIRAVLQLFDIDRAPDLYVDPVEAQERDLASQLLFSFKLNPRTVFFAGYSEDRFADTSAELTQTGWTVFVKLGYAWVL